MWVHWAKKLMKFTMNGTRVHLQGIKQDLTRCSSISKEGLKGLINRQAVAHCLQFRWEAKPDKLHEGVCAVTTLLDKQNIPELQVLLEQYAGLFQEPSSLPPTNYCNLIFASLLRKGVSVFMDDILIYSDTLPEHLELLQQVFQILRQNRFYIKLCKCAFAQTEVEFLGHNISGKGVATEASKIAAVEKWPRPTNLKELRGFLGLTGYYRKFIKHYGLISKPLSDLLKKNVPFVWTSITETAFQQLKQALVQAPVLGLPDFTKPFMIETDASDLGFGAVLMQEGHPIAYLSKPVCQKNQALSTYEKECMALVMAVDKWRAYLQNQEFIIKTDHKSLLHLFEQRVTTKLQQKALLKLMDLQYKVMYKQGPTNQAADALSRCHSHESVATISTCKPVWVDRVKEGYEEDDQATKLIEELKVAGGQLGAYTLSDGLIRHHGRVWLGSNKLAHHHILQAIHNSGVGGHSGFTATYYRVKKLFCWPGTKHDIQEFIASCQVCQQAKIIHAKPAGLL